MNEPRRQKLGRYRSPAQHPKLYSDLLQAYCRLTKRLLPLISASTVSHRGVGTYLNTLAWLAEVVTNGLVASYDTRSESSGKI